MGLTMADIMMEIEDQLNVSIDEGDEQKIKTVGDVYNYVWEKVQQRHKASLPTPSKPLMSREDMEKLIRKIMSKVTGTKEEKIIPTARMVEDLGWE